MISRLTLAQKVFLGIIVFMIISGIALVLTKPRDTTTTRQQSTVAPTTPGTATPLTGTRNVNYGPSVLDIYAPSGDAANYPVVILVHGGGWTLGDKDLLADEAKEFADAGFVALNINYPLASPSSAGHPMQERAVITAVDWAIAHKDELHINTNNIGLIGGSAGGHLVMLAGMIANKEAPGKVTAVVSLSGPADLYGIAQAIRSGDTAAYPDLKVPEPGDTDHVDNYLGCDIVSCSDTTLKEVSPQYNIDPTCPAIGILHSRNESQPDEFATQFYNDLTAAGCTTKLHILDSNLHAFAYWDKINTETIAWMNEQLRN